MKKHRIFALFMAMILTVSFAACGSSSSSGSTADSAAPADNGEASQAEAPSEEAASTGGKPTLYFLMNESDDNMRNWVAATQDQWAEENPDVDIQFEFSPGSVSEYQTKVRTMTSAGNPPDLWWSNAGSWTRPLIEAGEVLPLEEKLDAMDFFGTQCLSTTRAPSAYDGHVYGVPFESLLYNIVMYNKAIFAKYDLQPPQTLDEMKAVCQTLVDNGEPVFTTGASGGWPVAAILEGFAYMVDPHCTQDIMEGKATFVGNEAYIFAAETLKELLDMGCFSSNVALTSNDEAETIFTSGQAAMWPIYSYAIANSYAAMGEDAGYFFYPAKDEAGIPDIGKNLAGGVKADSGILLSSSIAEADQDAALELAISIARSYSQYYYEELGDPIIPFNAENFGWQLPEGMAQVSKDFAAATNNFEYSYGFLQDVVPTAAANAGVLAACSEFMTGTMTVDALMEALDTAVVAE